MAILDSLDRIFDTSAEKIADVVEKETYQRNCLPVVTLQFCITWAKKMRERFPKSAGFLIAVKSNPTPKNENDRFVVTLAMLDVYNQPISYGTDKGVSTLVYGKTIDQGLLNLLNGNESVLCKF